MTDEPLLDPAERQDRMILAQAGEFTKPGAQATVYERFLGTLMHGTEEDVQKVRDLIRAHEDSGAPFDALLTDRLSWHKH